MNFFLFDDYTLSEQLKPLTFTRPVAMIRIGIFTMMDRWTHFLGQKPTVSVVKRLQPLWPDCEDQAGIWINSAWLPSSDDARLVSSLPVDTALTNGSILLATHVTGKKGAPVNGEYQISKFNNRHEIEGAEIICRPWEIFSKNGKVIRSDFELIKEERNSCSVSDPFSRCYSIENIFIEEGVKMKACILNAEEGPIYIGKNAEIQEGSMLKGPLAILENSVINMGAKIRPDTTIGPFTKVGGEVNNCVFFGYSNKAHDGFLGNSVIGEWCNLGADTNNSNLKNNYGEVKVFSYAEQKMVSTGLQFCGLLMGDHSKTSINSMLNTGTTVGIASNIFDGGFPPKHIISFSWGGARDGFELYRFEKFLEAESRVLARRGKELTEDYIEILRRVYEDTRQLHRM